jgi:hypothetical protein
MRLYLGRRLGRRGFAGVSVPLSLPRTLPGAIAFILVLLVLGLFALLSQ